MNRLVFLTAVCVVATYSLLSSPAFAEDAVPCEDMLVNLRETIKTATLTDDNKAKVGRAGEQRY